jgi:membrane protein
MNTRGRFSGISWVWHLGGLTPLELVKRVWTEIDRDDVLGRAAQLSFYFLFALFPFLIFLSSLSGIVFAGQAELYKELLGYLREVMPGSAYEIVRATVDEITLGASGSKLSIGLLVALWTASTGMDAVINGLNIAYKINELRPWWRRRLLAAILTITLAVFAGLAVILVLHGGYFGGLIANIFGLGDLFGRFWFAIQIAFPPLFMLIAFAIVYRVAPNAREQGWHALMPGSFVAVVLFIAATAAFRMYLTYFDSYNKTYGSLGAVIVLMMWLYMSGVAVLVGGEVNSEIRRAAAAAGVPEAREPIEAPAET